jgi:hypothetical protein
MSLKFDHSRNTLSESMGMSEEQLYELAEKMADISSYFIKNKDKIGKSEVAEKIALEFSYSELIFIATGKIFESIDNALEKQQELFSILEKLSGMMKSKDKDEE